MKYQLVLQIPPGIPYLTYRNLVCNPHHQPWARNEFSWKNCCGIHIYFVPGYISCWSTDLESLLQVISVNSKGLIPLTCQGNSCYVEERNVGNRNTRGAHPAFIPSTILEHPRVYQFQEQTLAFGVLFGENTVSLQPRESSDALTGCWLFCVPTSLCSCVDHCANPAQRGRDADAAMCPVALGLE